MVFDAEDEEKEIKKVRALAEKCLRRMRGDKETGDGQPKEQVYSVREQRKIAFPMQPLNSTRNQDLADRKQRTFAPNVDLRIIEES
jgi:hypothetical protein